MVTMKRLALLGLAGACILSASFIRADYNRPMSLAPGAVISNLVVNYYDDRTTNTGSVVKIVDGCRVIYLTDTFITVNDQMAYNSTPTNIAVSDIECKKH